MYAICGDCEKQQQNTLVILAGGVNGQVNYYVIVNSISRSVVQHAYMGSLERMAGSLLGVKLSTLPISL